MDFGLLQQKKMTVVSIDHQHVDDGVMQIDETTDSVQYLWTGEDENDDQIELDIVSNVAIHYLMQVWKRYLVA